MNKKIFSKQDELRKEFESIFNSSTDLPLDKNSEGNYLSGEVQYAWKEYLKINYLSDINAMYGRGAE
ncbi:hypothetical protein L7O55_19040 [Escherichia coli]|uniref:hypothetical protein n=1 Tax=Enterobacteriaceae TaxID=543 RepID=UPI0014956D27|nr:hypothetical protein [Enterobacter roggenkampii]MCU6167252.1 hypothetical protein [Enterobacter roggenkampii]NPR32995.1 hypothetical protein [Escherichia coli]HCT4409045.1 hypothetical protein [Escherichia coli]